jgi:hypothetical protein
VSFPKTTEWTINDDVSKEALLQILKIWVATGDDFIDCPHYTYYIYYWKEFDLAKENQRPESKPLREKTSPTQF